MISDCEIVEIWHTIFLDFTCSLDIMEKVISKMFLFFISLCRFILVALFIPICSFAPPFVPISI